MQKIIINIIETVYGFLWGDLFTIPLPGGSSIGISLLIVLLIPTGIYFTVRTGFMQMRMIPDMVRTLAERMNRESGGLSAFQALIVSTAT